MTPREHEDQPTGYRESPDTTNAHPRTVKSMSDSSEEESTAPLTTDDEAQREDEAVRPGNMPD